MRGLVSACRSAVLTSRSMVWMQQCALNQGVSPVYDKMRCTALRQALAVLAVLGAMTVMTGDIHVTAADEAPDAALEQSDFVHGALN